MASTIRCVRGRYSPYKAPILGERVLGKQSKPAISRCAHPHPTVVSGTGAGMKRARCLSCGATGPERAGAAEAVRALRDQASGRAEAGA
jgi:hypothetical protein